MTLRLATRLLLDSAGLLLWLGAGTYLLFGSHRPTTSGEMGDSWAAECLREKSGLLVHRLSGVEWPADQVERLVAALGAWLLVGALWVVVRRSAGRFPGLLALMLAAASVPAAVFGRGFVWDTPALVAGVGAVWVLLSSGRNPKPIAAGAVALLSGVLAGSALAASPWACIGLVPVWLVLARGTWQRLAFAAGVLAVGGFLHLIGELPVWEDSSNEGWSMAPGWPLVALLTSPHSGLLLLMPWLLALLWWVRRRSDLSVLRARVPRSGRGRVATTALFGCVLAVGVFALREGWSGHERWCLDVAHRMQPLLLLGLAPALGRLSRAPLVGRGLGLVAVGAGAAWSGWLGYVFASMGEVPLRPVKPAPAPITVYDIGDGTRWFLAWERGAAFRPVWREGIPGFRGSLLWQKPSIVKGWNVLENWGGEPVRWSRLDSIEWRDANTTTTVVRYRVEHTDIGEEPVTVEVSDAESGALLHRRTITEIGHYAFDLAPSPTDRRIRWRVSRPYLTGGRDSRVLGVAVFYPSPSR